MVFSSRVIPGNERAIGTVQDNLVRRGVRLMTDADHAIHVSGHPARDELRRLYRLVKPPVAVPVHGEWRHLSAHAELAQEAGSTPVLLEDGDILNLAPGTIEVVDSAPVGRLVLDGNRLVPLAGGVMAARRRMLFNGVAVASRGGGRGRAACSAGRRSACPACSTPTIPKAPASPTNSTDAIADLPAPVAARRCRAGRGRPHRAAPRARPAAAEAPAGGRASAAGVSRR